MLAGWLVLEQALGQRLEVTLVRFALKLKAVLCNKRGQGRLIGMLFEQR